jgi:hypothetical protein
MTSISGSLPVDANSNIAPAIALPTMLTPVASADLAKTAVSLASDSSVVALLGANGAASAVYTASGLLDSLAQAGTSEGVAANSPTAPPQSLDQSLVALLSTAPAAASMYTAAGGLVSSTPDMTSNFATILKSRPGVAATFIHDSFDQGVVGTISTLA